MEVIEDRVQCWAFVLAMLNLRILLLQAQVVYLQMNSMLSRYLKFDDDDHFRGIITAVVWRDWGKVCKTSMVIAICLAPVISQVNPVCALRPNFLKICSNIFLPCNPRSSKLSLVSSFCSENIVVSFLRAPLLSNPTWFDHRANVWRRF